MRLLFKNTSYRLFFKAFFVIIDIGDNNGKI